MILDSSLLFDDKAAITASRPSTNVIDTRKGNDPGIGDRNLHLVMQVTTALAGPAGTTLQVQWQGSVDNATWVTIVESAAFPAVAVPAGTHFLAMQIPRQSPNPATPTGLFRYFRLNYVVGGGPLTAGAVSATIVLDPQASISYPKNFPTVNA